MSKPAVLHAPGASFRQLVAIPVTEALIYALGGATSTGWLAVQAGRLGVVALAACVAGLAAVLPVAALQLRRIDAAALQND